MNNKAFNPKQDETTSTNNPTRQVARQQSHIFGSIATRNSSQSPIYIVSTRYLEHTKRSHCLYLGPSHYRLTEIIQGNDPKVNSPKTIEVKQDEIRDLISRGTFRAVLRTEHLDGANMITAGYVLAIKSEEDKEDIHKARCVAERHLEIMKYYIAHGAQTSQCLSVRIFPLIANGKGFHVWAVDV